MKKTLTEIIFILDRSGSMAGLEADTIGGFNGFLTTQVADNQNTLLTTVLFDDKYEILWNGVNAKDAHLTSREYFVRGSTALLDAVGKTITDVDRRITRTPESERPDQVIFVITTDGMENSSREYNRSQIKQMIEHQQGMHHWQFIFQGANIDAAQEAENLGIAREDSRQFQATEDGMAKMFCDLSSFVSEKRQKK